MKNKWLIGVKVFAITDIIVGTLVVLPSAFFSLWKLRLNIRNILAPDGKFAVALSVILFLMSGVLLILPFSGALLFKLKGLGRKLLLYLSPLIAASGFVSLLVIYFYGEGNLDLLVLTLPGIGLSFYLVAQSFYLLAPKVKELFKHEESKPEFWALVTNIASLSLLILPLRYFQRFFKICIIAFVKKESLSAKMTALYPAPAILFFVLVVAVLIVVGLLHRKKWAFYLLIGFSSFQVLWSLRSLIYVLSGDLTMSLSTLKSFAVPVIKLYYFLSMIWFFTRRKVRQQFISATKGAPKNA